MLRSWFALGLTFICLAPLPAGATVITFDDPAALAAIPDKGISTMVAAYKEAGMSFLPRLVPPDPLLGGPGDRFWQEERRMGRRVEHFHLHYSLLDTLGPVEVNRRVMTGALDLTMQPRTLLAHSVGHTVQLTYDPDGDGRPNHFSLVGLDIISGQANVGICRASTLPCPRSALAVYNDLTAAGPGQAQHWGLTGSAATNIIRATLESPVSNFQVDNIEFVASTPPPAGAQAGPAEKVSGISFPQASGFSEELHAQVHALFPDLSSDGQMAAAPEPGTILLVGSGAMVLLCSVRFFRSPGELC